jgi:hypothetical protein
LRVESSRTNGRNSSIDGGRDDEAAEGGMAGGAGGQSVDTTVNSTVNSTVDENELFHLHLTQLMAMPMPVATQLSGDDHVHVRRTIELALDLDAAASVSAAAEPEGHVSHVGGGDRAVAGRLDYLLETRQHAIESLLSEAPGAVRRWGDG